MKKSEKILLILGIMFLSFNLRAPITAVGSIVDLIKNEYLLSSSGAGIITGLPLLAFAFISPIIPKISKKYPYSKLIIISLVVIFIGIYIRSYTNIQGLFLGTLLIGVGISTGNVLIPSIIKQHFANRVGLVTSLYIASMCIFAAIGAGGSSFLAKNLGWKNALGVWGALTFFTVIIWMSQKKVQFKEAPSTLKNDLEKVLEKEEESIWKHRLAWWVTFFMGLQSLIFYALVAWLPSVVSSKGLGDSYPSTMALVFQLTAIPVTLIIPSLGTKFKKQQGLVIFICISYVLGMGLLILAKTKLLVLISVILMSLGMGGLISLSIIFITLRTSNSSKSSQLSGMSQSAGYLLAATGPLIIGYLYDFSHNWTLPLIVLMMITLITCICGWFAGDNKII